MSAPEPSHAFNNTEWGDIPLLTYINSDTWNETMTLVLKAMDAYNIVTSGEAEPPQIDIDYHKWKIPAAKAKTTIHLSCSPAIQFLLKGLKSPAVMWTTPLARLENTGTNHYC